MCYWLPPKTSLARAQEGWLGFSVFSLGRLFKFLVRSNLPSGWRFAISHNFACSEKYRQMQMLQSSAFLTKILQILKLFPRIQVSWQRFLSINLFMPRYCNLGHIKNHVAAKKTITVTSKPICRWCIGYELKKIVAKLIPSAHVPELHTISPLLCWYDWREPNYHINTPILF